MCESTSMHKFLLSDTYVSQPTSPHDMSVNGYTDTEHTYTCTCTLYHIAVCHLSVTFMSLTSRLT